MQQAQYRILEVLNHMHVLAERVNDLREAGWTPIGGVGVATTSGGNTMYMQAMVRKEPN
jgi:hypothetical protein